MNQRLLNKLLSFILFLIIVGLVLILIFNKRQDLNYKNKMKDLIESNKQAQFKIDSAMNIIVKNNLEKIELNKHIDSLNETSQRLDQSVREVKQELKNIKNYHNLSYDSLYKIVKGRL